MIITYAVKERLVGNSLLESDCSGCARGNQAWHHGIIILGEKSLRNIIHRIMVKLFLVRFANFDSDCETRKASWKGGLYRK